MEKLCQHRKKLTILSILLVSASAVLNCAKKNDSNKDILSLFALYTLTSCQNTVKKYAYLAAFHSCKTDTVNCNTPTNHTIYLAGSDDGTNWSLIKEFTPRSGSVPDLYFYNNYLYVFHTQGSENWIKLNSCFQVVDSKTISISGTDSGFVDPSLITSGSNPVLYYLPGTTGSDPASCSTYPCTKSIHSATSDSSLTTFTQDSGNRVSITLSSGAFSDPDILARTNGQYNLYVSSGQSVYVYSATSLSSSFTSPDGSSPRAISNNSGGVPGAVEVGGQVWLYVTKSNSGIEVIRKGTSSDGITAISDSNFQTVIDYTISSDFTSKVSVSSPSVIAWPDSSWK